MNLSEAIFLAKERLSCIYEKDEVDAITIRLCEYYFGISRTEYYISKKEEVTDASLKLFILALDKLQQHYPLQYMLGETNFYGLTFKLDENVLIPRPETEELVDWICKDYYQTDNSPNILDIGTGSGAIAVSLAASIPSAHTTAIDISPSALKIAQTNANLNKVSIRFLEEDIFSPSPILTNHKFNIIVSNPPYVRESEKKDMRPNVLNYEPSLALFVPDNDPLKYYQAIARFSYQQLANSGSIYLEVNEDLANETLSLFSEDFYITKLRKDLNGKNRMLKISKL